MLKRYLANLFPFINVNNKINKLIYKSKTKNKYLSNYYVYKIYKKYNLIISNKATIKDVINFPHPVGIVIGEGVKIGKNVTIYQNVTIGRKDIDIAKYPSIGDNVVIYSGAKILGNIVIGNNSVIGANSVVLNDVPENSVVAGIPAKIINKKKDINEWYKKEFYL